MNAAAGLLVALRRCRRSCGFKWDQQLIHLLGTHVPVGFPRLGRLADRRERFPRLPQEMIDFPFISASD